jgi:hypothetical protein
MITQQKWKRALPFMALIFLTGSAFAQVKLTELSISSEYIPSSRYTRPDSVKTQSTTSVQRYALSSSFSLSNKTDTNTGKVSIWSASLGGTYTVFKNKDYEKDVFPSCLASADIGVTNFRSLRNRWNLLSLASVGVYTDTKDVDFNDVFFAAGALLIKTRSPKFSYGFGLVLTNYAGIPIPFPALYIQWELGNRYKLLVNSPDKEPGVIYRVGGMYVINKRTDIALSFRARVSSFDVAKRADGERSLGYWEIPIGLDNTWHFKNMDVTVGGGFMPGRSYEFSRRKLSEMFKDMPQHKLAPNYYLKASMRWRF